MAIKFAKHGKCKYDLENGTSTVNLVHIKGVKSNLITPNAPVYKL